MATFQQCLDFVRAFGILGLVHGLQQVAFHQVRFEGRLKKCLIGVFLLFRQAFQLGKLVVLGLFSSAEVKAHQR